MIGSFDSRTWTPRALVAILCTAQILVQIGAFFWPALLPAFMPLWQLSNTEAGWITASFYGAYMLSVPVLVTLTDRIDPKRVYLFGVAATVVGHLSFGLVADGFWSAMLMRAVTGIGWAGTYMTGLKLLADLVDAKLMSRATAGHAASSAFVLAAISATVAWVLVAIVLPRQMTPARQHPGGSGLYDFRPVFRNSAAMAYALVYGVHSLEANALRGWSVAFLAYVAATSADEASLWSPALVATALGLVATLASVVGNEASIRFGRKRLIVSALLGSIMIGAAIGFVGHVSYTIACVLVIVYGLVSWLDSASLTAGTAGTAESSRRGATLAVHSMLGYAGGFVGPLLIGWTLDLSGGMSSIGWGMSFLAIAILVFVALIVFWLIWPRELEGDNRKATIAKT